MLECGLVFQKMLSSGHLPAQWQNVGRTLRRVVEIVSYHPAAISPQAIRLTVVFTWHIGSRDGGTASVAGRTSRLLGGYAYVVVDGSALVAAQSIAGLHHLACVEVVRMNCWLARWARPQTL